MGTPASRTLSTDGTELHVYEVGDGDPVVFVHGNLSDSRVWLEQLERLPAERRGVAVDLRGFGKSAPAPVDATRGLRDYADDVVSVLDHLDIEVAHLVGHSLGGGVVQQVAIDAPDRVRSLVLVAPVPPFGFGGTFADGRSCTSDFAGSGGGVANPDLVRLLAAGDQSTDEPLSPRNVIRTLFFPTPDTIRDEEGILAQMLATRIGDDHYPGDATESANWPGVAPGTHGVLNALSPRFCDLTPFADTGATAPVLWVRGDQDAVVSDSSMVDLGHLGAIGAVPGWPGADAFPAQPMIQQTRDLLERYTAKGGSYREEVMEGAGHYPFTQRPDEFAAMLDGHLQQTG